MARPNTRQQVIKMLDSLSLKDIRDGEFELIKKLREKMFENEGPSGKKRIRTAKPKAEKSAPKKEKKQPVERTEEVI